MLDYGRFYQSDIRRSTPEPTVLLGFGLSLRSPSMTALAFAFLLLAHLFVVGYEERQLAGRFGESYVRYRLAVRRWLPPRPASSAGPGAG
jgi:protein-S-isoprenylcysteine O-methyltransferase Ste14